MNSRQSFETQNQFIKMAVENSRVAFVYVDVIEAKKYNLVWLIKCVACTMIKVEDHISLTLEFTSDDFACLKNKNVN